ncbi:hypothetical protein SH661x_003490 [Planctomicrobium sp. SH661]|uniref:hypothetical protein n=1 Tax=Planctomicrobium sp. SH661 TaxID=3448124 RepID=UPI003F5CA483
MQLAVLISESSPLPVLDALRSTPGVDLVSIWSSDRQIRDDLRPLFPAASFPEHWDELLLTSPDGVIVAGMSPEILAAAKQLANQGVPLLIVAESADGPRKLFDLMPIWQEHPDRISPLFQSGVQAASQSALQEFSASEKGPLWKIEFTRILDGRRIDHSSTSRVVDQKLLSDLKWIRDLAGLPQNVTMQISGTAEDPAEVTVLMGTAAVKEVRWSLRKENHEESWTLKLIGQRGQIQVRCQGDHLPVLEVDGLSRPLSIQNTKVEDAASQLRNWISAMEGDSAPQSWTEVIQLAEVGATARRSLLRRRTIDLHFEEISERSQFKTQMTAIGCGVLLWTMFGIVALLTLGGILDPRDREYRHSAAANFVISSNDFRLGHDQLTPSGQEKVTSIARRWSSTSPVLLIEKSTPTDSGLDQQREQRILNMLSDSGVRAPAEKTMVRAFQGQWFETAMKLAWILVFAPLGIVLLLQLLILVSRSAS